MPLDTVYEYIADLLGESVEVRDGAPNLYQTTHAIGPVKVWSAPHRPEVCVEVNGSACEALGLERVAILFFGLALRVSRFDLAADDHGGHLSPHLLRDHWFEGNVRSAARTPNLAALEKKGLTVKPGFEHVRSHGWHEKATGATFEMGSRQSHQYARAYDARGFTRFELELKDARAHAAAARLFEVVNESERFAAQALGIIRDFVDFVDTSADSNPSRAPTLAFWEAFCASVARARLALEGVPPRTLDDVLAWFEHQVAPAYALLREALGSPVLDRLAAAGRKRWRPRHVALLKSSGAVPATA